MIHVLRVPERLLSEIPDEARRWCFVCRKRVRFVRSVYTPRDVMSYYGPRAEITCEHGHLDGDCFPGTYREGA